MKPKHFLKEFKTRRGYSFFVISRVKNTLLNSFCDESVMYDIVNIDGTKDTITMLGIKNTIRYR